MRHSSRQKHLKHVHKSAHTRRMCYFRTVQCLTDPAESSVDHSAENQSETIEAEQTTPFKAQP
ncbi:hypothetical protein [Shewanella waksmanii]|uniref:hypothetical protein n=1 Tax=Shewanella waksmanii TaxID=213783 RepID=UPI00055CCC4B|nr:hypothetical protein [Shewanella waksmanii]